VKALNQYNLRFNQFLFNRIDMLYFDCMIQL